MNSGFVVLMGLSVVFVGLICIIFVCKLMSFVINDVFKVSAGKSEQAESLPAPAAAALDTAQRSSEAIPSRPELAAAIAAAIAEYTGKDISGIRILSIKKVS